MSALKEKGYPVAVTEHVTGCRFDLLRDYDRRGYIKPSVAQAEGRGSLRLYSYTDIVVLRVLTVMRELGVVPINALDVMDFLRQHEADLADPPRGLLLVTNSRTLFQLTEDPLAVWKEITEGRAVVPIPIGELIHVIKKELRQAAAKTTTGQSRQITFKQVVNA